MSLGIVVKAPEGLVLAAESRITLSTQPPQGQGIYVNFDNATKLLSFGEKHNFVGVVTYGQAAIGLRTPHSFIPEFESQLPQERISVQCFAQHFSDFFLQQWQAQMPADYKGPNMTFVIGGFDEGEPYGRVFQIDIPGNPAPTEKNPGNQFGITWGGQREVVDRLMQGYDHRLPDTISGALNLDAQQVQAMTQALTPLQMQIPLMGMPLQDCVNLAIFFIRTTIMAQRLTVGIRGCGGPIDVAILTRREGFKFIQRKQIVGEAEQIETSQA